MIAWLGKMLAKWGISLSMKQIMGGLKAASVAIIAAIVYSRGREAGRKKEKKNADTRVNKMLNRVSGALFSNRDLFRVRNPDKWGKGADPDPGVRVEPSDKDAG